MTLEKINRILEKEIEFSKKCDMPQFTLGLLQAQKIINKEFGEGK